METSFARHGLLDMRLFSKSRGKDKEMMNSGKNTTALIAIALLSLNLSACQKKEASADAKGPAEKAGQQLDQATARAGEELNKAAEKAGQGLQKAGKKLQDKAADAQSKQSDAQNKQ
jgi:16S rRNA G527 N7-methylase RsmG